jgi:hypothetical protein
MSQNARGEGDATVEEQSNKSAQKRAHDDGKDENGEPTPKLIKLPQKKNYRQRAHANPLSLNNLFRPKDPER